MPDERAVICGYGHSLGLPTHWGIHAEVEDCDNPWVPSFPATDSKPVKVPDPFLLENSVHWFTRSEIEEMEKRAGEAFIAGQIIPIPPERLEKMENPDPNSTVVEDA